MNLHDLPGQPPHNARKPLTGHMDRVQHIQTEEVLVLLRLGDRRAAFARDQGRVIPEAIGEQLGHGVIEPRREPHFGFQFFQESRAGDDQNVGVAHPR